MSWFKKRAEKFHQKYLEEHRQNQQSVQRVNKAMTTVGVIGPFSTSIQAGHIFMTKVVAGISPISWVLYTFVTTCWLFYGFFHKDRPLMIVNSLALLMDLAILTGYSMFH